jgi:hypothetical protein
MPKYPQIVLFPCFFPSGLMNQRLSFDVNSKPLNPEPLNPCMKLHEIRCHFRQVPHAVAEYALRPRRRPRPSRIVLVVVLVLVLDAVSSNFFTNLLFSTTSTRTTTKRIRINRMHMPCALNLIPVRSYETSVSFSIRPAVFLASGWAEP